MPFLINSFLVSTEVPSGSYRYWRVFVTGYNYATWQIHELELRSSAGGADLTSPSTPTTALNYVSGYEPEKSIDNNFSLAWRPSTSTNTWIYYDLSSATVVQEVGIACGQFASFKDFRVEGSNDASNWTTVKSFSNITSGWSESSLKLFSLV